MASFTIGSFTLDESSGLQGIPVVATATEDDNDNDALRSALPSSFHGFLFDAADADSLGLSTTFVDDIGVGESATNYIQVDSTGADITDLNFSTTGGAALPVFGAGTIDLGLTRSLLAILLHCRFVGNGSPVPHSSKR